MYSRLHETPSTSNDLVFSATEEEAERAGVKDRVTDWMFWKMGFRCLLSEAFNERLEENNNAMLLNEYTRSNMEYEQQKKDLRLKLLAEMDRKLDLEQRIMKVKDQLKDGNKMNPLRIFLAESYNDVTDRCIEISRELDHINKRYKHNRMLMDMLKRSNPRERKVIKKYVNDLSGIRDDRDFTREKYKELITNKLIAQNSGNEEVLRQEMVDTYYEESMVGSLSQSHDPFSEFLSHINGAKSSKNIEFKNKQEEETNVVGVVELYNPSSSPKEQLLDNL